MLGRKEAAVFECSPIYFSHRHTYNENKYVDLLLTSEGGLKVDLGQSDRSALCRPLETAGATQSYYRIVVTPSFLSP